MLIKKIFHGSLLTLCLVMLPVLSLMAQTADTATPPISLKEIGAGLAIGLAVIGGALGQGKAASAVLEGIARNPGAADKVFTPFILGMALIESLVIFALLIAFVILL